MLKLNLFSLRLTVIVNNYPTHLRVELKELKFFIVELINTRRTSVTSMGCPLADVKEDFPLLSDSKDIPVSEDHRTFSASTSVDGNRPVSRIGRRDSMRCQMSCASSNFLMVPPVHSSALSQSNSFSSYAGLSQCSSFSSLGEPSGVVDDGHSLSCFDRSSLFLSSTSIMSHADQTHTPSTMAESHSSDCETWMSKLPWLPVSSFRTIWTIHPFGKNDQNNYDTFLYVQSGDDSPRKSAKFCLRT